MSFYQNNNDRNESDKDVSYSPLQERLRREEEERMSRQQNKRRPGVFGYYFSGFIGVLVGALLVWFMIPSLVGEDSGSSISRTDNDTPKITQSATEVTTDVTKAVEKMSKAVVGITNIQEVANFWTRQSQETEAGSGSGVIYKVDGNKAYIVTNHHVVENAKQLEVTLADGTKEKAELVGSDIWTDLAVITIPSKNVETVAQFGNSDVLKQGETVIAIGNPLGMDFYGSVTTGVISGKDRSVPVDLNGDGTVDWETDVLQTDAAINPGNSGGALVNIAGEVVGINSMKIAEDRVEGLGFAIPINTVIPIIEELEKNGEVKRPAMGIGLMDLTDVPSFYQKQTLRLPDNVTTGVVVSEVVPGSPADRAGVKQYDVIVEMDGQKIENSIDLRKYLYNEKEIGDTLKVKVYRSGKEMELKLKLTEGSQL
ncbi:S1C family serine protease [Ureibacillus sp. FSL K6-8385]|uniref:Serine protease n=1 Tax=Ureibacillus terrenus TaxID=118246 RepID=A0A540V4C5_9BACL|nr:S1C family serine protease [Ureibacillus terrenus]MED3661640.1 S1C family serine protease [Ureibacillus terrenus]MED3763598.1 S1C family serine protease [Ureibacillus terrenus]TQE91083.1 serine protease [Ureibacillus terrenus]